MLRPSIGYDTINMTVIHLLAKQRTHFMKKLITYLLILSCSACLWGCKGAGTFEEVEAQGGEYTDSQEETIYYPSEEDAPAEEAEKKPEKKPNPKRKRSLPRKSLRNPKSLRRASPRPHRARPRPIINPSPAAAIPPSIGRRSDFKTPPPAFACSFPSPRIGRL